MPPWKSGTSSNESRFAFARPDNQGSATDSSLRKCGSEKNFSLLSQNYYGNVYQNDLGHQSLENSLAMSDMSATGECYGVFSIAISILGRIHNLVLLCSTLFLFPR
jgi:hypothetical protein